MPNLKKSDAEKVRVAGLKMSNWLYNLSQSDAFKIYYKDMREMVKEWDEAAPILRKIQAKRKAQEGQ